MGRRSLRISCVYMIDNQRIKFQSKKNLDLNSDSILQILPRLTGEVVSDLQSFPVRLWVISHSWSYVKCEQFNKGSLRQKVFGGPTTKFNQWFPPFSSTNLWSKESVPGKSLKNNPSNLFWLVVSTHLKDISQNGNLPQLGDKIEKYLKPPPRLFFVDSIPNPPTRKFPSRDLFQNRWERPLEFHPIGLTWVPHITSAPGTSIG